MKCPVDDDCLRYAHQLGLDEESAAEVEEILAEDEFNPWTAMHILEALDEYTPTTCMAGTATAYRDADALMIGREIKEHILRYWTDRACEEQQQREARRIREFFEEA